MISIVIPVYNVADYLQKCLDSLIVQCDKEVKLICVDDGSLDESGTILDEYQKKYPKLIEVIHKQNGGLSDARNAGLEIVKSDYVLFFDSDDFASENLISEVKKCINTHHPDLIVFDYYQYFSKTDTKEVIQIGCRQDKVYQLSLQPSILTKVKNAAWNKVYRTSLFKDIRYPKGYLYEDLGTTYKLFLKAKRICFINQPLYNYLADRGGNITTTVDRRLLQLKDMAKEMVEYYKSQRAFEEYREELKYLCVRNLSDGLRKLRFTSDKSLRKEVQESFFGYLKKTFPDYNQCKYPLKQQKYDWLYLNQRFCGLYYKYVV